MPPDVDEAARPRAGGLPPRLLRRVLWMTVPVTALITVLTFVDRSNLGLAAPVLLHDVSLTRPQYGLAASVFFVSYGLCMAPSAFLFTAVGLRAWMTAIVILWGAVTAATAAVRGFRSLVALRVLLGAAEAGTMPGCWFLLSRFVPADTLAYAYSWTLTFTVLAQVIGAPIGAAFLGPMQGVAGLAGWRWMFIAEGAGTALIGLLLPFFMADTVGACRWLTPADKRALADALHASAAAVGAPLPDVGPVPDATGAPPAPAAPEPVIASLRAAARVMRVWQVWALGVAVMLVQVAFFGVLYFAPLLISSAFGAADPVYEGPAAEAHKAMVAALKSVVVFGPAAAAMVAAGAWTRRTGDRKWASFACLTASAVSFGLVPAAARSGGGGAALAALTVGAAGGCATLSPLTTWPHRYIGVAGAHGAAAYAFWNSFVAVGGVAGPYAFGAMANGAFALLAGCQAVAAALLLAFGFWEDRDVRRVAAAKEAGDE